MRDIYLIDFENVASEGLSGITYLAPEDEVIIFYSNNSKSLSMKMHILIGKSVCKLDYFEAAVGGKNALDHQISTWLGYLIGTGAAERNYYIVSRDMGYKFVASFWSENEKTVRVRCVDSIKAAGRMERNRQQQRENVLKAVQEAQQETESIPAEETVPIAEPVPVEEALPVAEVAPVEVAAPVEETVTQVEPAPAEAIDQPEEPAEEKELAETQQTRSRSRRNRHSRGRRRSDSQASESKQETKQEPAEEPKQEEAPRVEEKPKSVQPARSGKKEEVFDLSALLIPYPNLQEEHLKTLIAEKKKQILCNTLRKQLGQEKGLALYNEIKRAAWR